MTDTEEKTVEQYCLWQHERGMNLENHAVKAIICNIHATTVEHGEKCQPINMTDGPLKKFTRGFYSRHPPLNRRSGEYVGCGHINMVNKDTITDYFKLLLETLMKCDIVKLDSNVEVIQESIKQESVYLTDETGWGVQSKCKQVIGCNGAKDVYLRQANDEIHKTLMLGICGNDEVIKPLILQKSFPLEILLCKINKGSMGKKRCFLSVA